MTRRFGLTSVLPRVDLNTNVRGERVHGLHSKPVGVTSVSNGYVRNGRQACLVPYQVLSGHARTRAIHCLFFLREKQNKRIIQTSSLVILQFELLQSATYRLPRRSKENPTGRLS
jgi:hypothetical protein